MTDQALEIERELIAALLEEYPPLIDYDATTQMSKERAAEFWNIDPRSALERMHRMVREGKLVKLAVRNPETNREMTVFTKPD